MSISPSPLTSLACLKYFSFNVLCPNTTNFNKKVSPVSTSPSPLTSPRTATVYSSFITQPVESLASEFKTSPFEFLAVTSLPIRFEKSWTVAPGTVVTLLVTVLILTLSFLITASSSGTSGVDGFSSSTGTKYNL